MTPFQLLSLLLEVGVEVLKLYRQQAACKGQKLSTAEKQLINSAIVTAIKTKNTSELEAAIKATSGEPTPLEGNKP